LLKLWRNDRHTGDDAFNRLDCRLLGIDVVGYLLAPPQHDNAINYLKYVVNVVGDKDA
jgi:hypothetical protein